MTTAELVEATLFVLNAINPESDEEFSSADFPQLAGDPYRQIPSIERICRFILINASNHPDYEGLADDALSNVGRKNSVLSGTDMALLIGGLGLAALIFKPKESEETTYYDENGKKVTKKIRYQNLGKFMASIINAILGHTDAGNSKQDEE